MTNHVEPDVPVETQAKNQIVAHLKGNWVGWVIGLLGILVVTFSNTYVDGRADKRITAAGGVTVDQVHTLENAVTELRGAVDAQVLVNLQQDERLNDSIDRLDGVIDSLIRANQPSQ